MPLALDLRVSDRREDETFHSVRVELRGPRGDMLDADWWRFVKSTKRRILNPVEPTFDADGNPVELWAFFDSHPPDWTPAWSPEVEGNRFDWQLLMRLAADYFLRRQGMLASGEQWAPPGMDSGLSASVNRSDPIALTTQRMVGGGILVDTGLDYPPQHLRLLTPKLGTTTVTEEDSVAGLAVKLQANTTTCYTAETSTHLIGTTADEYATTHSWDLSAISGSDTIDSASFICEVTQVGGWVEGQLEPSGTNGQTDPLGVACATRIANASPDANTPYLDNFTDFTSTGEKTLTLGGSVTTHIAAAIDNNSGLFHMHGNWADQILGTGNKFARFAHPAHATYDGARLSIVHTAAGGSILPQMMHHLS